MFAKVQIILAIVITILSGSYIVLHSHGCDLPCISAYRTRYAHTHSLKYVFNPTINFYSTIALKFFHILLFIGLIYQAFDIIELNQTIKSRPVILPAYLQRNLYTNKEEATTQESLNCTNYTFDNSAN